MDHVGSEATIFKLSQTPPSVLMLERWNFIGMFLGTVRLTFQNLSASSASLTGEREVLSGGFFISKPCARKNVATGEKYSDAQNHAPQWGNPIKLIIWILFGKCLKFCLFWVLDKGNLNLIVGNDYNFCLLGNVDEIKRKWMLNGEMVQMFSYRGMLWKKCKPECLIKELGMFKIINGGIFMSRCFLSGGCLWYKVNLNA